LLGELRDEIFIKQPKDFKTDPSLVYKLHKSLYDLKQSPRYWNIKFVTFLKSFNFKQCEADKCVLQAQNDGNLKFFLVIYIDNGLICKNLEIINKILANLDKQFKISINSLNCFIGLEIHRNMERKEILRNQSYYC